MATQNVPLTSAHRTFSLRLPAAGLLIRFALVPVAVAICYLFSWQFLRYWTAEFNLGLDLLAGIHLQRVSFDQVLWKGVLYRYQIACTMADVWCGAIPLLWNWRRSLFRNLILLAGFAVGIFTLNVLRLSFSDVLFAAGFPWNVAHNVIGGISYFIVWVWLWTSPYSPVFAYRSSVQSAFSK